MSITITGCSAFPPLPPDGTYGNWYQLDPVWKDNLYDTTTPPKNTIGDQGCALTVLAACMAFAGYTNNGIAPLPPGPYDPATLNLALDRIPGAYSPPITPKLNSGGIIDWSSAVTGASALPPPLQGSSLFFDSKTGQNASTSTQALDAYLCTSSPKPVIVKVPGSMATGDCLTSAGLNNPNCPHHFVLVTEKTAAAGYSTIDPGHNLGNPTPLDLGKVFAVVGAVKKANGDPSVLAFVVSDTATLLVTAPDGSQTGYDPVSGQAVQSISLQSMYLEQDNCIDTDAETVAATTAVYSVDYSFPPDGTYTVELVGLQSGPYQLGINAFDANGAQENYIVKSGVATAGSSSTFQIKFSSAAGSSTTVTRTATFASTLADIANSVGLGLIDNAGLANALSSKINAASDAAARGDSATATNVLNAFENQVSAQTGKHITGVAPQMLLEDAAFLISSLPPTQGN